MVDGKRVSERKPYCRRLAPLILSGIALFAAGCRNLGDSGGGSGVEQMGASATRAAERMVGNVTDGKTVAALPGVNVGGLRISDVVIPAPAGRAPAAMYFTASMSGTVDSPTSGTPPGADTLVSVRIEGVTGALHDSRGGGMKEAGILAVTAANPLVLRPGGIHVMFTLPGRVPVAGDSLNVEVVFRIAGRVRVRVPVVPYEELERLFDPSVDPHR